MIFLCFGYVFNILRQWWFKGRHNFAGPSEQIKIRWKQPKAICDLWPTVVMNDKLESTTLSICSLWGSSH